MRDNTQVKLCFRKIIVKKCSEQKNDTNFLRNSIDRLFRTIGDSYPSQDIFSVFDIFLAGLLKRKKYPKWSFM